jgi:hypothetical protein
MAYFAAYDAVGNRECLLDYITNISPKETPIISALGKVQLTNTHYSWQTDTLRAPASNTHVQGFTYSGAQGSVVPTVLITNETQIFYQGYDISATQEAIIHAGRASEVAYQKEKAMAEYARDIEYAIINQTTATAASSGVPGVSKGLGGYLTGNYTITSDAINKTVSAALTKDILDAQLQIAWLNGAVGINDLFMNSKQKQVINAFPGTIRKMDEQDTNLKGLVNVYESDWGVFELKLDRWLADSVIYGLNTSMWDIGVLRPTTSMTHPRTASGESFGIEGEMSFTTRNPQGSTALSSIS